MTDPTEAKVSAESVPTADHGAATLPSAVQGETAPPLLDHPRGLVGGAWLVLRRRPMFWISAVLILIFLLAAVWPSLFTSADPNYGTLERSMGEPGTDGAVFGYNLQGQDLWARIVYGAQASITVSVVSTALTVLLGATLGVIAAYRGRWSDTLLSRLADVFFGIPIALGSLVILSTFNPPGAPPDRLRVESLVISTLVVLSWPVAMRIMRSSVITGKHADYVVAARALGAGPTRIIVKHLVPNCLAPLLVFATIMVGTFIGAEATLSYLGIGLKPPVVSWGIEVAAAKDYIRVAPHMLFLPAAVLVLAVFSFVMLGETIREALDPKLR